MSNSRHVQVRALRGPPNNGKSRSPAARMFLGVKRDEIAGHSGLSFPRKGRSRSAGASLASVVLSAQIS